MEAVVAVSLAVLIIALTTAALGFWSYGKSCKKKDSGSLPAGLKKDDASKPSNKGDGPKESNKKKAAAKVAKPPPAPELAVTLKGFSSTVLDAAFSHSGTFIACVSEDRTVRVFLTKSLGSNNHKYVRVNVPFDHGIKLAFTPEDDKLVVALHSGDVMVYDVAAGADGKSVTVTESGVKFDPQQKGDVTFINIHTPTIVTSSTGADVTFKVFAMNGDLLSAIDTKQFRMHESLSSPNGRFIAAATFSSEVRVWEVVFHKKTKAVESVTKVMDATKHTKAVHRLAWSPASDRLVTISEDGTWRVWNLDVRYHMQEDPKTLVTGDLPFPASSVLAAAITPDNTRVVMLLESEMVVFNLESGKKTGSVGMTGYEGTHMSIAHNSKTVVTSGVGKHAHIWKLP